MDVIRYKYIFIGFSAVLTVLAVFGMFYFGFKEGIDFSGGTFWQLRFNNEFSVERLNNFLSKENLESTVRQGDIARDFSIRMKEIDEAKHQELLKSFQREFGALEELSFSSIGPAIGSELRGNALLAFFLVLLGISLYVAFAFRKVSYPVSSWKYGLVTLITLFHDALIPAGFFTWFSSQYGAEIDTNFIVSVLVVMGFSVHDTIVVFDRIRENLLLSKNKENLNKIINESIHQTFARSVNTSLTLVLVLLALYLFGAQSLGYFTLLILIGTIVGTYSSIFVASPMLTFFSRQGSK